MFSENFLFFLLHFSKWHTGNEIVTSLSTKWSAGGSTTTTSGPVSDTGTETVTGASWTDGIAAGSLTDDSSAVGPTFTVVGAPCEFTCAFLPKTKLATLVVFPSSVTGMPPRDAAGEGWSVVGFCPSVRFSDDGCLSCSDSAISGDLLDKVPRFGIFFLKQRPRTTPIDRNTRLIAKQLCSKNFVVWLKNDTFN